MISSSLFSLNQGMALLVVELPLAILLYALITSLKFFGKPNMRVSCSDQASLYRCCNVLITPLMSDGDLFHGVPDIATNVH